MTTRTDYDLVAWYIERNFIFLVDDGGMIFADKNDKEIFYVDSFLYHLVKVFGLAKDLDLWEILKQWFKNQLRGDKNCWDIYNERCKNPQDLPLFYRKMKLDYKLKGLEKYIR